MRAVLKNQVITCVFYTDTPAAENAVELDATGIDPLSFFTFDGIPAKKVIGGRVVDRGPAEIAADRAKLPPRPKTQEERLQALETLGESLNEGFKRLEKLFGGVRK